MASVVHAQPFAGTALRFTGSNYVSILHNSAYNLFPFTVSAWVRTTNFNGSPEGLVSKYFSSGFNGWSMHTVNGRLRAWFFSGSGSYIWNPFGDGFGVDGGFIADGRWHHVAFAVDPAGGRLFVDGVFQQNLGWSGTPGGPTTTAPLHFGAIANFSVLYRGDVDEVSLWNYALTNDSINYIKFRQLNGNEDGLASYWRLNEGSGLTVAETTPSARTGNLIGGPQWLNSTAPIALSPVAGSGLKLDGVDDQVSVNHAADLNAYPLTITAWIRTSRIVPNYDAIVNKYASGSGNGYSLHVFNGRLAAFYFRGTAGDHVYSGDPGFDGGFIADGQFHHVAFTVDASGGKIYVDGVLRGSLGWSGSAGPPTTTTPVLIGKYPSFSTLLGQIDEVTLWNRSFTATEIQSMQNLPRAGNEPGLIACWPFNENFGTTGGDLTGNGHSAALQNGATWAGSIARLGDGSVHLLGSLDQATYGRFWALQTSPNLFAFPVFTVGAMRRFHDFGPGPGPVSLELMTAGGLRNGALQEMPLKFPSTLSFPLNLVSENANAPATNSYVPLGNMVLIDPVQLDSVNQTYAASMSLAHSIGAGPIITNGTLTLPSTRLLHFDGHLRFGPVDTIFTQIGNDPAPGALTGGGIATQLAVTNNSGYLPANPNHTYGTGTPLNATLFPDGHAEASGNFTVPMTAPNPDRSTVANLTFKRYTMILTNTGLRARISLCLPGGFSWGQVDFRTATSEYGFDYDFALDENLRPVSSVLSEAYVFDWLEETKPFWMRGNGISWNIPAGEITLGAPVSLHFVREVADHALATNQSRLVDPVMARRVSNDGYFRGATTVNGPVVIRGDSNGLALLNIDLSLAGGELRPHFPYSPRHLPGLSVTSGRMVVSNDVIDLVQSALQVAGAFPVTYARDCDETNCPGVTTAGPATLNFSANGNELDFTSDGGLVAHGAVPPQNLEWGYAGGTNFAQRTSDVTSGAYHMPGTFLFREATTLSNHVLPAVLLFTGVGNGANTTYRERPGELAYADGFANYAGANFRGPTDGRSYIANTNTAWYPLTPRAKYYARFGGISGIHEAASFPASLSLYGYPFTFTTYRLSYLDSENWQSRTDGSVRLRGPGDVPPGPAGFNQEFEEMKFLCRGGLESARVAPFSGEKFLSYWNTYFTPQSVQFRGLNGDDCNLGNRFLVLGAETKLPFIPQKLHAALGFKPSGNLVAAADNVSGCDSRFAVPAQLFLEAAQGGKFKLTTAGPGYFNNWDLPDRPAAGFYNLAGKIDLPFFEDSKAHLHVEPSGRTTANVFVMGGWRAADKFGSDEGWSEGAQNFFTASGFDSMHRGFPSGVSLLDYRRGLGTKYHPRAQREWLELVKFDYALQWDAALRQFSSVEDSRTELPVIDLDSRLKQLTPRKIDIDFAQDIALQLPRLKVLDLANDALDEINQPLNSVSNAVREAFQATVDAAGLTRGLRSLQRTLRDEMESFLRPVLEPTLDPVVDSLYPVLSNLLSTDSANFLRNVSNAVGGASADLKGAVRNINGTAAQANSVIGQLHSVLADVDDTLGLFIRILEKDGQGHRHVVRLIVQKIAQDQGPDLGIVADLADPIVNSLLENLEPTLAEIDRRLKSVRAELSALRAQLGVATGEFSRAVSSVTGTAGALDQYVGLAGTAVSNLMAFVVTPAGDYFRTNPTEAKRQMRERLIVAFLASTLPAEYQRTFKQFLYDDNAIVNQLMDTLFQQINRTVREGIQDQLTSARDGVFQQLKGGGLVSSTLGSAKIRGGPEFNGDAMRKIRLDADVNMRIPDDMKFQAFIQVLELDSQNTPISCIPAGGAAAEVTLGATDVPLAWAGLEGGQSLDVSARWSLQNNKTVYGVGGALELHGDTQFKSASLESFGAALAIGQTESYFAARAAGSAKGGAYSFSAELGFFAGKTCRPDPLKMVDPEVELMIPNPTDFTGIYVAYGGKFPLTQLIGVPPSCFLRADGTMKTVFFYQGGPRLGIFGGRLKLGLDVELLCVIGAHVDYGPFLRVSGSELSFGGTANVCGKLGVCPFCLEGCADLTIKGVVNDGGIDYFVDF